MKSILLVILCLIGSRVLNAQELQASVTINTEQLQLDQQRGTSQIYSELQRTAQDFLSGRRWSMDNFAPDEKIKLSINLLLTKASAQGDFEANARVQVLRPVYGTSYETVILNMIDKSFNFKFQTGTPITYNDNTFIDNLSSLLAYYAYLSCAYHYDSFGKYGGDFFVQLASHWKKNYTGWSAWVLTPDLKLPGRMRLKESRRVPMWNGPIECRMFRFDLMKGSVRDKL